jgi:Family of unknown function (DUF5677)
MSEMIGETMEFGYREFWPQARKEHAPMLSLVSKLTILLNKMLYASDKKQRGEVELAVYYLTQITGFGMNDVRLLCGNGSGTGAMKIVRGMFETSLLAEYLRCNPNEVSDYVDFGCVLGWRRFQQLTGKERERVPPERVKQLEDEYNEVKDRFTNKNGDVRHRWTTKSIGKMAEELGRSDQYDLVYGLACSLHHANFEGLTGHFEMKDGGLKMDGPPSLAWTDAALISAHMFLVLALNTLNDSSELGFDDRITGAIRDFESVRDES